MLVLRRPLPAAFVLIALGSLAPSRADAHFVLEKPAAIMSQDVLGSPQKLGPCGDEAVSPPATPTGMVTTYQEGQTITITVDGIIPHSGHWRVALGMTGPSDLPPEPAVTAGSTPCGSAAIESPAVFPVLGDNLLPSTSGFTGVQTMQVTLPPGVTCTKCTLQVLQFMSNHPLNNPGGCFYHHCADISIVAAGTDGGTGTGGTTTGTATGGSTTTGTATGGQPAGTGGGAAGGPEAKSGCGCSVPGTTSPGFMALGSLIGLAALLRRPRRATP